MDNVGQLKTVGHRTFPRMRWAFALLAMIHHLLAFSWFLVLLVLYTFSWRVQAVIGHWPQPYVDDPKFVAPDDWLSDLLYSAVHWFFIVAIVAIVALPYLCRYMQYRFSRF